MAEFGGHGCSLYVMVGEIVCCRGYGLLISCRPLDWETSRTKKVNKVVMEEEG